MLEAVAVCPGKVCAAMCGQNAKLTVTVERIDGGKLRCTGATWTDAVIIFPGEVLAFQNIERQAHALRAPAPGAVVKDQPAEPDLGEDDFETPPDGVGTPRSREDDFEAPPGEGGARERCRPRDVPRDNRGRR